MGTILSTCQAVIPKELNKHIWTSFSVTMTSPSRSLGPSLVLFSSYFIPSAWKIHLFSWLQQPTICRVFNIFITSFLSSRLTATWISYTYLKRHSMKYPKNHFNHIILKVIFNYLLLFTSCRTLDKLLHLLEHTILHL